jgi:hypothetical protein
VLENRLKVFFYLAFGAEFVLLWIMIFDRPHTDENSNTNKLRTYGASRTPDLAQSEAMADEISVGAMQVA